MIISTFIVSESCKQYKYNGQEYHDELGLNLYDMDFRDYDPAIGRWTGIDPVVHYSQSTYNAFDGNPVFWSDPSGADAISYTRDSNGEWKQSSIQSDEEFKDDLRRFGLPDYLNYLPQGNFDGSIGGIDDVNNNNPYTRLNNPSIKISSDKLPNTGKYLNGESVILKDGSEYVLWDNTWVKVENTDKNGNIITEVKFARGGSMSVKQKAVMGINIRNGTGSAVLSSVKVSSAPGLYSIITSGIKKAITIPSFVLTYAHSRYNSAIQMEQNMKIHDSAVQANR